VEFLEQLRGNAASSLQGSGSYLRRLAGKALGEGRAAELWSDKQPKGPVAALSRLDAQAILGMLENEQPQTISVILTQFDSMKASEILKLMPADVRADVLLRIAKLNEIPTQVIDDIEQVFAAEVAALGDASAAKAGGLTVAADILKRFGAEESAELLELLQSQDSATADGLRGAMFTFEDLLRIDSRGMQMLLKEVQTDKLVTAL
jgi:flagellar motor switch protein FliG